MGEAGTVISAKTDYNSKGSDWLTGVTRPHLEVELCLGEVLVQSGRQVLRRGQNDAADTNITAVLPQLDTLMCAAAAGWESGASYLLVRSRITFQSRGKMLSFIRFLKTHKIFSRNS